MGFVKKMFVPDTSAQTEAIRKQTEAQVSASQAAARSAAEQQRTADERLKASEKAREALSQPSETVDVSLGTPAESTEARRTRRAQFGVGPSSSGTGVRI